MSRTDPRVRDAWRSLGRRERKRARAIGET